MWRIVSLGRRVIRRALLGLLGLTAVFKLGSAAAAAVSMLLSVLIYAVAFGGRFAVGFVLLLLAHEAGHLAASRVAGLKTSVPLFLPFIGAVISLKQAPRNIKTEANIAIGGPALGTLTALLCLTVYFWNDSSLFLVLAYTAGLLNLFNLIPCEPLDGGRIARAIAPRSWWLGSLLTGLLFLYTYNIFILAIFGFSLLRFWRDDGGDQGAEYYNIDIHRRLTVLWWYLGLVAVLGLTTLYIADLLM